MLRVNTNVPEKQNGVRDPKAADPFRKFPAIYRNSLSAFPSFRNTVSPVESSRASLSVEM